MNRYKRRAPLAIPGINHKDHYLTGFIWPVDSSRGTETYNVEMVEGGFVCTCIGFSSHGKCKHIKKVGEGFFVETH
jgi:hypothetical protein